jgi:hypothetical protein
MTYREPGLLMPVEAFKTERLCRGCAFDTTGQGWFAGAYALRSFGC